MLLHFVRVSYRKLLFTCHHNFICKQCFYLPHFSFPRTIVGVLVAYSTLEFSASIRVEERKIIEYSTAVEETEERLSRQCGTK